MNSMWVVRELQPVVGVVQVVLVLTVVIIMRRVEDRRTITHAS